jgi:hypothetical protein
MKKLTYLAALLLATTSFAQVPNYVPTNGLVGWWPFNGNANDESGNGLNLNEIGDVSLTTDRNNINLKAYNFTNSLNNSRLEFSNSNYNIVDNLISGTISMWINLQQQDITNHYFGFDNMFLVRQKNGQNTQICFGLSGGTTQVRVHLNGALPYNQDLISQSSLGINQWHHIVFTWNGSVEKLFFDGVLEAQQNSTNYIEYIANPDIFCIGSYGGIIGSNATYAKLDDLGIWNNALTTCEIKDLYNSQLGSTNSTSSQTQTALDTYIWPVNNQTYTHSGTYSDTLVNAAGCDSIVTLNLTLNYTGINENNSSSLVISPNPTTGSFSLHGLEQLGTITSLRIIDNNGKVVQVLDPKATQFACSSLKTGVYFLEVISSTFNEIIKLIKE